MIKSILGSLLVLLCITSVAFSQGRIVTTSEESHSTSIKGFARDFYFCLIENYELQGGGGGKYYQMYATSPSRTNVHIALGKDSDKKFPIQAEEVLIFDVPLTWEITQSGTIENKAIHAWSEDADLSISLLSRSPGTSDGMTIIPTSSWGKSYVVGSFASYGYTPGTELPSEFAIVSKEDNTVVAIRPSTGLREGSNTAIAYPAHQEFTVVLNKGQSVQYQASAANGELTGHDVTGTIINATKPVGVVAGVQCANIPASAPYCDHICDMLLPIDRWGETYYTVPFINRKGGDCFLVVAAEDNTIITRTSKSGVRTHATLNKYQPYFQYDIDEASKWESSKPFMLVQYINSTDYPDAGANNGIGDPAMVVIPPVSLYEKEVLFQTPKIRTAEIQFRNYVNLIVHKNAVQTTRFDGQNIGGKLNSIDLPGTDYKLFRYSDAKPGVHSFMSDSAVGVYGYGYGSYDSYTWPMSMGSFVTSSSDVLAPKVDVAQTCYTAQVTVKDTGAPAIGQLMSSLDTLSNVKLEPVFFSGVDRSLASYKFSVIDSSKNAFLKITFIDGAGNRRYITHAYAPDLPKMPEGVIVTETPVGEQSSLALFFTSGQQSATASITARLKRGTDFKVLSVPGSVPASETDTIRLTYTQASAATVRDTLIVDAECWHHEIALRGSATSFAAFDLTDTVLSYGLVVVGNSRERKDKVYSYGTEPFTVDSIILAPTADFELETGILPITLTARDSAEFKVRFAPKSDGPKGGFITVHTSIGSMTVRLEGLGRDLLSVNSAANGSGFSIYPNPAKDVLSVTLDERTAEQAAGYRVLNASGAEIIRSLEMLRAPGFDLDVRHLNSGSFFLEITMKDGVVLSRKFSIER